MRCKIPFAAALQGPLACRARMSRTAAAIGLVLMIFAGAVEIAVTGAVSWVRARKKSSRRTKATGNKAEGFLDIKKRIIYAVFTPCCEAAHFICVTIYKQIVIICVQVTNLLNLVTRNACSSGPIH